MLIMATSVIACIKQQAKVPLSAGFYMPCADDRYLNRSAPCVTSWELLWSLKISLPGAFGRALVQ